MTHDPSKVQTSAWRVRFEAALQERMRRPFAWGTHDCCIFAADMVQAQTGVDLAADLRGSYSDAAGAARALATLGGIEVAGARAGEEIPPLHAQVGDIGLVHFDGRDMLAVCSGMHWLTPATRGMGAQPFASASRAWRVARA